MRGGGAGPDPNANADRTAGDGGDGDSDGSLWGWVVLAVVLALVTAVAVGAGRRKRTRDRQLCDYDQRMQGGDRGSAQTALNDAYCPSGARGGLGSGNDYVGKHVAAPAPGTANCAMLHGTRACYGERRGNGGPTPTTAQRAPLPLYEVSDYNGSVHRMPYTDTAGYVVSDYNGSVHRMPYTDTAGYVVPVPVDNPDDGIYAVCNDGNTAITVVCAGNEYAIPVEATDA